MIDQLNTSIEGTPEQVVEHIMHAIAEITLALMNGRLQQCYMLWDIQGVKTFNGAGLFSFDPAKRGNFITELKNSMVDIEAENRKRAS